MCCSWTAETLGTVVRHKVRAMSNKAGAQVRKGPEQQEPCRPAKDARVRVSQGYRSGLNKKQQWLTEMMVSERLINSHSLNTVHSDDVLRV